jgi:hypothetical protein
MNSRIIGLLMECGTLIYCIFWLCVCL